MVNGYNLPYTAEEIEKLLKNAGVEVFNLSDYGISMSEVLMSGNVKTAQDCTALVYVVTASLGASKTPVLFDSMANVYAVVTAVAPGYQIGGTLFGDMGDYILKADVVIAVDAIYLYTSELSKKGTNGGSTSGAKVLDLTGYGTGETIADAIQRLILEDGGSAEVSGVGSLWEDAAAPGPLAVTFPFDSYTLRSAGTTAIALGDYTIQLCFGAICYHRDLGVVDVSVVINISGADSATVMVNLMKPGPDREDLVAELVPAVIAALPKYNGEVVEQ